MGPGPDRFRSVAAYFPWRVDRLALAGTIDLPPLGRRADGHPVPMRRLTGVCGRRLLMPRFLKGELIGMRAVAAPPDQHGTIKFCINFGDVEVPGPGRYEYALGIGDSSDCRVPFEVCPPAS